MQMDFGWFSIRFITVQAVSSCLHRSINIPSKSSPTRSLPEFLSIAFAAALPPQVPGRRCSGPWVNIFTIPISGRQGGWDGLSSDQSIIQFIISWMCTNITSAISLGGIACLVRFGIQKDLLSDAASPGVRKKSYLTCYGLKMFISTRIVAHKSNVTACASPLKSRAVHAVPAHRRRRAGRAPRGSD